MAEEAKEYAVTVTLGGTREEIATRLRMAASKIEHADLDAKVGAGRKFLYGVNTATLEVT